MSGALYWSDDRLLDSERVGFGGQSFGRGYPRDQSDGDKGWGVAYEVSYSMRGSRLALVQPYLAVDAAQTWHNRESVEDAHLASAALGVRLEDGRLFNVALEVAKPLADVALDSLDRAPGLTLSVGLQL